MVGREGSVHQNGPSLVCFSAQSCGAGPGSGTGTILAGDKVDKVSHWSTQCSPLLCRSIRPVNPRNI